MSKMLQAKNGKVSISAYERLSRLAFIVYNKDQLCLELAINNVWWWKHQYGTVEEYNAAAKKTRQFIEALRKVYTDGTRQLVLLVDNFSAMAILGCEQIIQPNQYRMGSGIKFKEDEFIKEFIDSLVESN